MPGGNWRGQAPKRRPGAYVEIESYPRPMMEMGDRGIMSIPMYLEWGAENELIEVYSSEMVDGSSIAKVGFSMANATTVLQSIRGWRLARALGECYLAKVFRSNTGGNKAAAVLGYLNAEAKFSGTLGNRIIVAVIAAGNLWDVVTFVDEEQQDSQRVADIDGLVANDFVVFSKTAESAVLAANAGTPLTGGTNGTAAQESTYYPKWLNLLKTARFQTMAAPTLEANTQDLVYQFVKQQREEEGRTIQAVVPMFDTVDYDGIINWQSGTVISEQEYTIEDAACVFAGITAGSPVITTSSRSASNTGYVIQGATRIINPLSNTEIIKAIDLGKTVLSVDALGRVQIEIDINSYHTPTPLRNIEFSKNRILRTFDEIRSTIAATWDRSYKGKFDNTEDNRALFKGDVVAYLQSLNDGGALQNFAGAADVNVTQGRKANEVKTEAWIYPTDSMEILYFVAYSQVSG